MRTTLAALAVCAALALPRVAHAQSAEVKKYLNAAVTLYENLEYEKAMKQIARAKTKSTGATDDARIALYEGIVLADMGKEQKALDAFKTGLSMEPDAKLPLEVSPKVEKVFQTARENVQKLLGPQLEKQRAEEQARIDAEKAALAEEQRKKDEEAAKAAAAAKPAEPDRPPPLPTVKKAVSSGPSMRVLAVIPLVIGVGAGATGGYFLATASGQHSALTSGLAPPAQAASIRDQGKTNALLGYVFTGVGAAGLAAAVVMFAAGGKSSGSGDGLMISAMPTPDGAFVGVGGTLP